MLLWLWLAAVVWLWLFLSLLLFFPQAFCVRSVTKSFPRFSSLSFRFCRTSNQRLLPFLPSFS